MKLKPGYDAAAVAVIQEGLRKLNCPGTISYTVGDDLGLRDGTWSFAIVGDFADADAYRGYDADPEHDALRAQLAGYAEQVARVQYALD